MFIKSLLFFLIVSFIIPQSIYSDDIWFLLPSNNQPVTGKMTIKIHPPYQLVSVNVWIIDDRTEMMVWRGLLTQDNNYSIVVDTTRFKPGKYEINAQYYIGRKDYDGDIDIWVNPL
ncbi:MAG: hypothetical protein ACRCVW_04015 [Brevinema sp.]